MLQYHYMKLNKQKGGENNMTIKQISEYTWHLLDRSNVRIASFSTKEAARKYIANNRGYISQKLYLKEAARRKTNLMQV